MDLLDILSSILLVIFSIWGSWYLYWDVRRRWLIPEEQGNARVLLFGLVCVVIAGIIVFLSLLVDFEILPDFRLWSLG
jgi:hypothetical protein